jgi:hypothetical protein
VAITSSKEESAPCLARARRVAEEENLIGELRMDVKMVSLFGSPKSVGLILKRPMFTVLVQVDPMLPRTHNENLESKVSDVYRYQRRRAWTKPQGRSWV